jgi:hypothetical protein
MPSGYTCQIQSDTPFSQWALACARAMGATIMMRDDPLDTPIPDEFEPNTKYHDEGIADAQTRLMQLADMTDEKIAADLKHRNDEQIAARKKTIIEDGQTRAKYERMLAMVNEWTPPTKDHEGLQKFMQEQIAQSIRFDCHDDEDFLNRCYPLYVMTPQEWREKQIAKEHENLAYHHKHRQEEIERTRQRNEWVKQLRESLK